MPIDDWTIHDVIAAPNKALKSSLNVECDENSNVKRVMAGFNEDILEIFFLENGDTLN
ncbi:hypothetical protein H9L19_08110 [Weissella diestrammenae]|uniref:Uncharacterized protein n=1 Tax=Weissella diestrammenae TaxID=1162633 RepID=A0A7G9T5D7_9LACO|nr:hypothetical protein [Weissella diestrammenae]QNN75312.1 hypothetical protein H9L19_08110 [Weissella diestrammenae]